MAGPRCKWINPEMKIFISLTALTAEDRAHALAAIFATETGITLAVTQQAFTLTATAVWTIVRHVFGDHCYERDFLRITIVVVQRKEPVARLHVVRHFLLDRWLDEKPTSLSDFFVISLPFSFLFFRDETL